MDCSTLGFPALHYLPEFAQTYVPSADDAIRPSHPLSSPSPPAFNLIPASGSFPMSWLFAASGQRIGASASVTVCSDFGVQENKICLPENQYESI